MKRVHIIGRKNSGKTTLIVELLRELTRRGLRVGSIKHTPHDYELDTPGKDSHRLREAGANPSAIVTGKLLAAYIPRGEGDPYALLAPLFDSCDLVLVESNKEAHATKIEVWRSASGEPPIAHEREDVAALVTDDATGRPVEAGLPVWPRGDVSLVADGLLAMLDLAPEG